MKKMISWNVNGLRACVGKGFLDVFHENGVILPTQWFGLSET